MNKYVHQLTEISKKTWLSPWPTLVEENVAQNLIKYLAKEPKNISGLISFCYVSKNTDAFCVIFDKNACLHVNIFPIQC